MSVLRTFRLLHVWHWHWDYVVWILAADKVEPREEVSGLNLVNRQSEDVKCSEKNFTSHSWNLN